MFIAVLSVQPDTPPFASRLLLLQMYCPVATARKIVRGNYPLPIAYFDAATDAPKFVPARTGVGAGALPSPGSAWMGTCPISPAWWLILPCAREGIFLPERTRLGNGHRLRESRGSTGRCLCASLDSFSIDSDGCTKVKRRVLGIKTIALTRIYSNISWVSCSAWR